MKLNGWQRIGVVVSIFWGIGAAIYERKSQVDSAQELYIAETNRCLPAWTNDCLAIANKNYLELLAFNSSGVSNILFVSLGSILVSWFTAYLAIKVFFWVKTGFQSNV